MRLDWRHGVYGDSHKGAGLGSIFVLERLGSEQWFDDYFATCDSMFDRNNGLMGLDKPPTGDDDQIGGTFHYSFLYEHFHRPMPYPERRIDTVIGLQQHDGYWDTGNPLWLSFDAVYLMTRTLRYCHYRLDDVRQAVRRVMSALMRDAFGPEGRTRTFSGRLGSHLVTAAISLSAEAQSFLGSREVITSWPLRFVLDRRPFI